MRQQHQYYVSQDRKREGYCRRIGTRPRLHLSGSTETDRDSIPLHNDGHNPLSLRVDEHLLQGDLIISDINVFDRETSSHKDFPGFSRIRTRLFTINDDVLLHVSSLKNDKNHTDYIQYINYTVIIKIGPPEFSRIWFM